MIHAAARKAVGWVEIDGEVRGHAVLVGPRRAVTCAHVLSKDEQRPDDKGGYGKRASR